jgi:hypothetical protein
VNNRVLHIQTELLRGTSNAAITIVSAGGKTLWKKATPVEASCPPDAIGLIIDRQHETVETGLRKRLNDALKQLQSSPETAGQRFSRLFDEGYERIRRLDYAGALALWKEALALDPSSKVLEVNMKIAQDKLNALKES